VFKCKLYFLSDYLRGDSMEIYAGAALTGMGYLLNKQRDMLRKSGPGVPETRDKPSMNNIYSSDYWTAVRKDEQRRGGEMYANAQSPLTTGVVPKPAYASMFAPQEAPKTYPDNQKYVSSLSGQDIPVEQFTHNNMQPYFRGTAKQSLDPFANSTLLESHTGRGDLLMHKQETQCFFEPTANYTNICGMPNNADYYMSHIQAPVARRNEFPIEQIRVGPGLNKGFSADPSGGFQQADTADYLGYKTVDELRPLSKPKVNLQEGPQGPMKGTTQRGAVGEFAKNRPDTWYEQTPDQWLKTTGSVFKESGRPVQNVKPTNRVETHVEYEGHASGASQPGQGDKHDYGKGSIMVYDNERMTTETRTVVSNLTSVVKAIVAPFIDALRHTPKEYTVDAARTYGTMSAQIPSKPTLYDPVNHMMRTTIKETTIHDTQVANLKGPNEGTTHLMDDAKTTTRETMPVEDTTRNISGRTYRVVVYSPDAVAKTTIKETTDGAKNEFGFIGGPVEKMTGAYSHIEVQVPNTQKQFVSDNDHYGTSKSTNDFRPVSDAAERNAEIDGTREALNIASGYTPNAGGLYTGLDPDYVDVDSKKAMVDSLAPRATGNVTRVNQTTAMHMSPCELSRGAPNALNGNEQRLDPGVLASLKSNPYNLNINPIS
jgi:hypothetical protein